MEMKKRISLELRNRSPAEVCDKNTGELLCNSQNKQPKDAIRHDGKVPRETGVASSAVSAEAVVRNPAPRRTWSSEGGSSLRCGSRSGLRGLRRVQRLSLTSRAVEGAPRVSRVQLRANRQTTEIPVRFRAAGSSPGRSAGTEARWFRENQPGWVKPFG